MRRTLPFSDCSGACVLGLLRIAGADQEGLVPSRDDGSTVVELRSSHPVEEDGLGTVHPVRTPGIDPKAAQAVEGFVGPGVVGVDEAVLCEVAIEGEAHEAALTLGVDGHLEEGRREDLAVFHDHGPTALLRHVNAAVRTDRQ